MSDDDATATSDGEGDDGPERDDGSGGDHGPYPIEGTALVKTAALASVPAARVPDLLARVQAELGPRIERYRRRYERIAAESDREAFLVEPDHWASVGDRVGLSERQRDAVVRAHEAAVERIGSGAGRRDEFDTALEIRSGVVIGVDEGDPDDEDDASDPDDEGDAGDLDDEDDTSDPDDEDGGASADRGADGGDD